MYRYTGAVVVLLVSLLLMSPARADDEAVGTLTEVTGTVRLLRGENVLETRRGVEVIPQDIIETGNNGTAQIDLKDGSVLRLAPGSRLALSDYKLDKDRNVISATVDVLTGWLRFAVSKLRKDDSKYRINAPSLTIGIRGTEGVVEADAKEGSVHLVSGRIEVGGQDAHGKPLPPVQVNAGEYIQRLQGQTFRRLTAPPPAFQKRVPPVVVRQLAARPLKPAERPIIQPRVVRKLTPVEARQIIQRHPHAQELLQRRFQPLLTPGAPGPTLRKDLTPGAGGERKPAIIREGIGGQLPPGRLAPVQGPAGVTPLPVKPTMPVVPHPPARPLQPTLPTTVPSRPGLPPMAAPPAPGMRPAAPPMTAPPAVPKKPDDQKHDQSAPPDSPGAASPPPPRLPAGANHPPPRQIIRKIRQHPQ